MVIRKSSLVFLILGILFVMLYSLVIVSGDISDSRLYFDFYIYIQEKGYFNFLNFVIILILFFVIFKFYQKNLDKNFILNSIYFISLLFLWYPIYSNSLWVWRERNHLHDRLITQEISQLGFLTDLQRSHRVADWAYKQAIENEYLVWLGGKEMKIFAAVY
jgi:hypothetical protein